MDGVDLDLEDYGSTPASVINCIKKLRAKLGSKYLIFFTAENVTVYASSVVSVPTTTTTNQFWNYMVPVINGCLDYIDYVQVMMYNNPYLEKTPGSAAYFVANY